MIALYKNRIANFLPVNSLTKGNVARISAWTFLLFISSQIKIPTYTVPITLQTFCLYIMLQTLRPKEAVFSTAAFLIAGFVGFPIFSGYRSGLNPTLIPSFGFLVGFLVSIALSSYLFRKLGDSIRHYFLSSVICCFIVHIFGILWLAKFIGLKQSINCDIATFFFPELIKLSSATIVFATRKNIKSRVGVCSHNQEKLL